jgi:hypothetical protein
VVVLILSIVAAYLSWRYVERPFRRSGVAALSSIAISRLSVGAIVLFCSAGIACARTGGLPARFSAKVNRLAAFAACGRGLP